MSRRTNRENPDGLQGWEPNGGIDGLVTPQTIKFDETPVSLRKREAAEAREAARLHAAELRQAAVYLGRWVTKGVALDRLDAVTAELSRPESIFRLPEHPLGIVYLMRRQLYLPGKQTPMSNENVRQVAGMEDVRMGLVEMHPTAKWPRTVYGRPVTLERKAGSKRYWDIALRLSTDSERDTVSSDIADESVFARTFYAADMSLRRRRQALPVRQYLVLGTATVNVVMPPDVQELLQDMPPITLGPVDCPIPKASDFGSAGVQ